MRAKLLTFHCKNKGNTHYTSRAISCKINFMARLLLGLCNNLDKLIIEKISSLL